MSYFLDVRNTRDMSLLLDVIMNVAADQRKPIDRSVIPIVLGQLQAFASFPRSGMVPALVWFDTGKDVIVSMAGISSAAQAVTLFDSSVIPMGQARDFGANAIGLTVARALLFSLNNAFGVGPRRWLLCGHSYGGSLAAILGGLLLGQDGGNRVQILSFGSPRPGDSRLADVLTQSTIRRVFNDNDSVSVFPPHLNEAPAASVTLGLAAVNIYSQYVQPNGGLQLDALGNFTVKVDAGFIGPGAASDMLGWITGKDGISGNGHSLATYRLRMNNALIQRGNGPLDITPGSGAGAPLGVSQAAFNAVATVVTEAPHTPAGGFTMAVVTIPKSYRPAIAKIDVSLYAVIINGAILVECPTLSKAKSFRKWLYKMLRVYMTCGAVDQAGFVAAITGFLAASVNPASGFAPILTPI